MKVQFIVHADFIMDLARERLWLENLEYEKAEDMILSCMGGTDLPMLELKRMAKCVLFFQACLGGNSADGITYDESDQTRTEEFQRIKKTVAYRVRKNGVANSYEIEFIKAYLPTLDYCEDYGWLSPSGEFFPAPFGNHTQWADDYVLGDEKRKNLFDQCSCYTPDLFLTDILGFVLLHNPRQGTAYITKSLNPIKRMTQYQKSFLIRYYEERGINPYKMDFLKDDYS